MRISHNVAAMVAQHAISKNQLSLNSSLEKLSTGTRINRASDDAAGLSVSENLRTQVRGLAQAKRNAEQGMALLQVAEGSAAEMNNVLQRMRELAVQNANSTLTDTERGYTDTEYQAMISEITRISQSAQYNGMTLLDGESGSFGVSGGANSVLHIGANSLSGVDTISIQIDAVTAGSLSIQSTGISTATSATGVLTTIDSAINSVNSMRAGLGSYINRIESAVSNMSDQEVTMAAAESSIRDVDFAYETTKFTKSQIMAQVGASMLAQANASSANILAFFT